MPSIHSYNFVRSLGKGGSGIVELWEKKYGDEALVVAKKVYVGETSQAELDEAKQEVSYLKNMKHPHIVHFISSWVHKATEDLIIVQEFCKGGDLKQAITDRKIARSHFSADQVLQWLSELVHALQYCLKIHKVMHRDLKPSNVFLSEHVAEGLDHVRLGDFGIARTLGSTASLCHTFIGTQAYMSPELVRMQSYGPKSDVWGLGAIFYEVCTLKRLYDIRGVADLMTSIASPGEAPKMQADCGYPDSYCKLCEAMLIKDAKTRPSLDQLLLDSECLRSAVLQLERDMAWTNSLVPSREEHAATMQHRESLVALFKQFDKDSDGVINLEELTLILQKVDQRWDSAAAGRLMEAAHTSHGDHMKYEEFIAWLLTDHEDEWSDVRRAVFGAKVPSNAETIINVVVNGDGTPHDLGRSWGKKSQMISTADLVGSVLESSTGSPTKATESPHSRLRDVTKPSNATDGLATVFESQEELTAALEEAAKVTDLLELTLRSREFKDVLEKLDLPELDKDPLCSDVDVLPSDSEANDEPNDIDDLLRDPFDFSAWSIRELKEYAFARGASLAGIAEKAELITLCKDMHSGKQLGPTAGKTAMQELQEKARVVDARLKCLDVLQSEKVDTSNISVAIQKAQEHDLLEEPCGVALVAQTHRLRMHAEDVVNNENASLVAVEEAAAMLEVAGRIVAPSHPLEHQANKRMQRVRQEKKQLGIRSTCGAFVKILSVPYDSSLSEMQSLVAQKWDRQVRSFTFFGHDGAEFVPLQQEEDWQRCLQDVAGHVEVQLRINRATMAADKRMAVPKLAAKSTPKPPAVKLAPKSLKPTVQPFAENAHQNGWYASQHRPSPKSNPLQVVSPFADVRQNGVSGWNVSQHRPSPKSSPLSVVSPFANARQTGPPISSQHRPSPKSSSPRPGSRGRSSLAGLAASGSRR